MRRDFLTGTRCGLVFFRFFSAPSQKPGWCRVQMLRMTVGGTRKSKDDDGLGVGQINIGGRGESHSRVGLGRPRKCWHLFGLLQHQNK